MLRVVAQAIVGPYHAKGTRSIPVWPCVRSIEKSMEVQARMKQQKPCRS